ncbi:ornithine carbamoyltransferase [Pelomonas cellulosilytica]|uniref:Ornithine carbamoyltransferase n=1 Tax=Pelomonas cellulosilytica TaxID=2906762 RepID=A0ABS8XZH3_9BURK|nr:ornithine carbamoyltransferase [Pelomonas sp. P8]MCE4557090.1 ornithine carbamoyltransferase [Pelomonas sp. P8]
MSMILSPWSPDALGRDGLRALTSRAEGLSRAAADGGALPQLLRGKRLALLSDAPDSPDATAFLQAANELGAHVALVRAGSAAGPRNRAKLLGQLYDGIECQGLTETELGQLERDAGVPVFDGIGNPGHPIYAVDGLRACPPRHVLQALLCTALA